MSTLDSLIRLHRWRLDEARRQVAELEQLTAKLRAELEALHQEQIAEQAAARNSPEASFAYGNYAGAVIERRRKLTHSLIATEQQATKAREALAEIFQEVKRYEIAAARRRLAQRVETERREQSQKDDLGTEIFRRRNPA